MADKNSRNHLDELLARAEARVAELKQKQKQKDSREAAKLGKRLYTRIAEGRASFTDEFKKIRAEIFDDSAPADGSVVTQEPTVADPTGSRDSDTGGVDHAR